MAAGSIRTCGCLVSVVLLAGLCGCRSWHRDGLKPEHLAHARQISQQGLAALEQGDNAQAQQLLAQAVSLYPHDVATRWALAQACFAVGRLDEAAVQLEEARRLTPRDPQLAVDLGNLLLTAGRTDRALDLANEALDLEPNVDGGWVLRGRVLHQRGRLDEALADYHRALGKAPKDSLALTLAARAYLDRRQPERALTCLQAVRECYCSDNLPEEVETLERYVLAAMGRNQGSEAPLTASLQSVDRTR